jgi:hypothetical protein
MALKNGKVNPLNVLGLRRVDFPAHHFVYTIVPKYSPTILSKIDNWIKNNLNGRYYIGQSINLDSNNTFIYTTKIGFENEKELSFFSLAFSDLNI